MTLKLIVTATFEIDDVVVAKHTDWCRITDQVDPATSPLVGSAFRLMGQNVGEKLTPDSDKATSNGYHLAMRDAIAAGVPI